MKLLSPFQLTTSRLLPTTNTVFTATAVIGMVALEWFGRNFTRNDLQDLCALISLGVLGGFLLMRHRAKPFGWVLACHRIGQDLINRLTRRTYDYGIDLRGEPNYPQKLPFLIWGVILFMAAWAVAAGVAWLQMPNGWREPLAGHFYLGYLLLLFTVWAGILLYVFAVGIYLPLLLMEDRLAQLQRDSDRRLEVLAIVAYALVVLVMARFVPSILVIAVLGVIIVGCITIMVKSGPQCPGLLWRRRSQPTIYCLSLRKIIVTLTLLASLAILNLLLTSGGGRLFGGSELPSSMQLTTLLGTVAAWFVPLTLGIFGMKLAINLRHDPALRTAATVRILGGSEEEQAEAYGLIRGWGWRATKGSNKPSDAVTIRLVSPELSEAEEFEPNWPLPVSMADLRAGQVRDRLARRDQIQLRRKITTTISQLFKEAFSEFRRKGGWIWLAPHWWFVDTLGREEPPSSRRSQPVLRPIGPMFRELFAIRARQHLHEILRKAGIDMIVVEDGVTHRSVIRVLRTLFELYDIHDGQRQAEDHHFLGIPKVKVMIHVYSPGVKFQPNGYPERSFDEISRARVLHLYKDRGGEEELLENPFDTSWEPAPALGIG